jgi:hypothetical protein
MKNVEDGVFTESDFSWDVAQIVVSPDGQKLAFPGRCRSQDRLPPE